MAKNKDHYEREEYLLLNVTLAGASDFCAIFKEEMGDRIVFRSTPLDAVGVANWKTVTRNVHTRKVVDEKDWGNVVVGLMICSDGDGFDLVEKYDNFLCLLRKGMPVGIARCSLTPDEEKRLVHDDGPQLVG